MSSLHLEHLPKDLAPQPHNWRCSDIKKRPFAMFMFRYLSKGGLN